MGKNLNNLEERLVDRFLRYVRIPSASDPRSDTFPSTNGQLSFAGQLAGELELMGLQEVMVDKNGYVTATIPATLSEAVPVVGFVAHMDTSPDFPAVNVNPQIVTAYDGKRIVLNHEKGIWLDPVEFPELSAYQGKTVITTDGTTLLGADDKAGVAEIVTAAEYLMGHPEMPHGKIRICFTPDEEIGRGADRFDLEGFGADFAYTVDGGQLGELEFENFNAALARVSISGKSVHPGEAKDKMVNANLLAHRFISMLPARQRPEHTEGREGFFHLTSWNGQVSEASLEMLIRDHDKEKFEEKKELLKEIARQLNAECNYQPVKVDIRDQYYNMRQKIEGAMYVVDLAEKAMAQAGVVPKIIAIRGGTDGARLSWMGLPCPNLFTGGHNYHGPYEYVVVESMIKAVEVILNVCRLVPSLKIAK